MEKIRSWFHRDNTSGQPLKQNKPDAPDSHDVTETGSLASTNQSIADKKQVDPKVAEYFRDFPEPYRTKAISRFSSREGLYRWDILRDFAMEREFQSAVRGTFLEDKRELLKSIQEEEQRNVEKARAKAKEEKEQRELTDWEKAIRAKIPVQENESLGLKLFQTANFITLGGLVVVAAINLKKRKPHLSNLTYGMTVAGSLYVCGYLQVAALYRFMDWGPFDRSVDNRTALTKQMDEIKGYFASFAEKTLEGKKISTEEKK